MTPAAAALWLGVAALCAYLLLSMDAIRRRSQRCLSAMGAARSLASDLHHYEGSLARAPRPPPLPAYVREALSDLTVLRDAGGNENAVGTFGAAATALAAAADPSVPADAATMERAERALHELEGALSEMDAASIEELHACTRALRLRWLGCAALAPLLLLGLLALARRLRSARLQADVLADSRAALLESDRRFKLLVHRSQDMIWTADPEGRILFASGASARIYGYAPEELVGRRLRDLAAPDSAEKDAGAVRALVAGRGDQEYETVHQRKDGRPVRLRVSAATVRDPEGLLVGIGGAATDLTVLHEMQERFMQAERLQALGTLASGVAHDFNNLLTVICGHAEIAKKAGGLPEGLARRLDAILESSVRAQRLTQQLLAFARRSASTHREVVDLASVLRHMDDLLTRLLGKQVRLVLELPPGAVRVRGDWSQLEQAVVNLAVNARDAMPEGGSIRLRVERLALSRSDASRLGVTPGEWARLDVEDQGVGMDSETLRRAFEPFFTTKGPGKGTGLGLANVQGVVANHGGRVTIASAVGKGTTVSILLPLCSEPHPKPAAGLVAPKSAAKEPAREKGVE